jgi:trehalose-phosphatase
MDRPKARHLFRSWDKVARCLRPSRNIALFLDFDGTLAPLRPRPEDVWLDVSTRRTLLRLARSPRFRVWIVTGRLKADIRVRVRVAGIHYLSLHGRNGRSDAVVANETREVIDYAKIWLGALLLSVRGIWLEDKGLTVAIHYESVADEGVRRARRMVWGVLQSFGASLQLIRGKKVWEVAPTELGDKGVAVRHALTSLARSAVPVYVGDDQMDEPAFAELARGITVHVGSSCRTRAHYRLSSVVQVRQFLERLEREFS